MKHYLSTTLLILLVAAVIFFAAAFLFVKDDARAAIAILTLGGLTSLILYASTHSRELRRSN